MANTNDLVNSRRLMGQTSAYLCMLARKHTPAKIDQHRGRQLAAPLPHHLACGSAPGSSRSFVRCGQLTGGLSPPRSRPCWAHTTPRPETLGIL